MTVEMIKPALFYGFALITVVSALMVLVKDNPVTSAINLVLTFFSLAAIYVIMDAQFIAVMQVLVYAGAIMVLFIFIIMLLNLRPLVLEKINQKYTRAALVIFLVLILASSILSIMSVIRSFPETSTGHGTWTKHAVEQAGSVQVFAKVMFTEFLLPFEMASLLLTVAIVCVVVMARSMKLRPEYSRSDKMEESQKNNQGVR